jgi:outer membrane immunogenic protein
VEADIQGSGAQGSGGFSGAAEWNALTDAPFQLDGQSSALPLQLLPGEGVVSVNRAAASTTTVSRRIDSFGTVRARVGYLALPTLLLYATGGVAYGGVKSATAQSQTINNSISTAYCLNDPTCPANPGSLILSNAGVPQASLGGVGRYGGMRVGWTLGAGMEWLFMPRWSVKAEYLYFDLGAKSYASSPLVSTGASLSWIPNSTTMNESVTRVRFNGSIVRVGLNYHFN